MGMTHPPLPAPMAFPRMCLLIALLLAPPLAVTALRIPSEDIALNSTEGAALLEGASHLRGRGLHSYTSQLNLSRV